MLSRYIVVFLFSAVPVLNGYAQNDQVIPQNLSEIIFYRTKKSAGAGMIVSIYADNQPITRVQHNSFTRQVMKSGDHIFSAGLGNPSVVRLNMEPGKTYYVKCDFFSSFWSNKIILSLMDPTVGKSEISNLGINEKPAESFTETPGRSRLGLTLGFGFGFESIPLFYLQGGDEVSLSTGGGFSLGAQYSFDVNKKFNLSLDCFYEGSMLSTTLTNGDGTFDRMGVTVTPAFIIPLKGGRQYRFLAGGGAGLYCFGTMNIDQSQLGGSEYTLKYKVAPGYHLSLGFHARVTEKSAMSIGVKYYYIHYKFTMEGSTAMPNDPEFLEPNGSGLDFVLGYHIVF